MYVLLLNAILLLIRSSKILSYLIQKQLVYKISVNIKEPIPLYLLIKKVLNGWDECNLGKVIFSIWRACLHACKVYKYWDSHVSHAIWMIELVLNNYCNPNLKVSRLFSGCVKKIYCKTVVFFFLVILVQLVLQIWDRTKW
jgi:hypothetical protein